MIIAYVVALELLLAGVAASACLLVLAIVGALVKQQEQPPRRVPTAGFVSEALALSPIGNQPGSCEER